MQRKFKDCRDCRMTAHEGKCVYCAGRGSVPCAPGVGETVLYWPPLGGFLKEQVESGEITTTSLRDVAGFLPLFVTDAVTFRAGSQLGTDIKIEGWVLSRSQRLRKPHPDEVKEKAQWVDGFGWVVPVRMPPPLKFVENVMGPREEPGCWTWRKEPS